MQINLADIVVATGGKVLCGVPTGAFSNVSTDTRTIKDGAIFVALRGEIHDAHDFIDDAIVNGALCLIVSQHIDIKALNKAISVVLVPDTLMALGDVAHWWREKFTLPVIAVTGSSGKTTTKEMLFTLCSKRAKTLKSEGNFNNLIGLPQSLFLLNHEHELAIVEMGTNCFGEIARLTQIATPTIGIITNIGRAHMGGFGSFDGIKQEKLSLFSGMDTDKIIVVNNDDDAVASYARNSGQRQFSFGIKTDADIRATDIRATAERTVFTVNANGKKFACELPVIGLHNVYNALAALAAAQAAGFKLDDILVGSLFDYKPAKRRFNIIKLACGAFLVDDSYNANPDSMRQALKAVADVSNGSGNGGAKIAVLGDMWELGENAPEFHREIGICAGEIGFTKLLLRGEFAQVVAQGAMSAGISYENIVLFDDVAHAVDDIVCTLKDGDWILVKASRTMKMEQVVDAIVKKGGIKGDETT